ncbi:hypothetical protein CJD36_002015 [Flavipsychrobacter stenotrophus]|uniref:Uncharacterized protein n=1 Tax=Flavipsychrobacter stenotrophus TaxID=2077091 RepID=A0A2S7T154_9BACT|nr:hypothetical protein [Flavipsychrobacter stenotrophus]PQJ12545.1 hypothetical protein CJD36_002015 [Flavipsychrobacter stenotrophus]
MRTLITVLFTCISFIAVGQKQGSSKIDYTTNYKTVTKRCHYCGKSFSLSTPAKIAIKSGSQEDIQSMEINRLFQAKMRNDLNENESCTSSQNRTRKHVFYEEDNKNSTTSKTYSMTKDEADIYISGLEPYMNRYASTIKKISFMVFSADIK